MTKKNQDEIVPEGMREASELEQEVLQYLNELRDSGDTNMFGAAPYVEAHFGVDRHEARVYMKLWRTNFNTDGNYEFLKAD